MDRGYKRNQIGEFLGETSFCYVERDKRADRTYYLIFKKQRPPEAVTKLLFPSGIPPAGVTLRNLEHDYSELRPPRTWQMKLDIDLRVFGEVERIINQMNEELGQVLFSIQNSELLRLTQDESEAIAQRTEAYLNYLRTTKVPFDNLTIMEVIKSYKPGYYEKSGYTIYVGRIEDSYRYGLQFIKDADWKGDRYDNAYLRDIKEYLKQGHSLSASLRLTHELWSRLNIRMLGAFATTLSAAPGSGAPTGRFSVPNTVAQGYTFVQGGQLNDLIKLFSGKSEKDLSTVEKEHYALSVDIKERLQVLHAKIGGWTPFTKELRTGQMGEAIIIQTLESKGYKTFQIQNNSGNGIDIIAFKQIGGEWYVIFLEIKSSLDKNFNLSNYQKDPESFVKNRLTEAANATGRYAKLSPDQRAVAKLCLEHLDAGRTRAVHLAVHVGFARKLGPIFNTKLYYWKSSGLRPIIRPGRR